MVACFSGDNTLSAVMIKCPNTGKLIATGIETDEDSFGRLPDALSRTYCPHCGVEHAWWKREALLVDRPPDP
jgi:hypothetical protein